MGNERETRPSVRDHLLGRLSEAESERGDELSVTDPDYHADLIAEEELLIESYVDSKLTPADENDFRRAFAARPDLRERIALERSLRTNLREPSTSRPGKDPILPFPSTVWRWGFSIAASLAILMPAAGFLGYFLSDQARQSHEIEWSKRYTSQQQELQQSQAENAKLQAMIARNSTSATPAQGGELPSLASLRVTPLARSVAEVPKLEVPPGRSIVEVNLSLGAEIAYEQYRVDVLFGGEQIASVLTKPRIVGSYRVLSVPILIDFPGSRQYLAKVKGVVPNSADQPVDNYSFVLERK